MALYLIPSYVTLEVNVNDAVLFKVVKLQCCPCSGKVLAFGHMK